MPGRQGEPRPGNGVTSLLEATHGVVIGQRQNIDPCGPGVLDELGGLVITIRGGGVGMKVDDCWHASMLGARLERWPSLPPLHLGRIARPRPFRKHFVTLSKPGWADFQSEPASPLPHVPLVQARREAVSAAFPGTTLIIPAGSTKVRSNDTDYPYRPHTDFTYLTGWGSGTTPGSILLGTPEGETHQWALFVLPPAPRTSDEFYANPAIGEFWTGRRPGLDDVGVWLGLVTKDLESWSLDDLDMAASAVVASAEESLTREIRERRGTEDASTDDRLAEVISEMRLVKDDYEVSELTEAIAATHRGFQDIIRALPDAVGDPRGERIVEEPSTHGPGAKEMMSGMAPSRPVVPMPASCTG